MRAQLLALAAVIVVAGTAHAQPGTVFVEGRGGGMIPVGNFRHKLNPGGAYSIAAGYEMVEFIDLLLEFTHSFNDTDNLHFTGPDFTAFSDEVAQTFVVGAGPRISFLPSEYLVRPYGLFQVGWYHFATFNSIKVDGVKILDDHDADAVGIQAGLGIEGTIFQLYERRSDRYPLMEVTLGVQGAYHQAFEPSAPDKQFRGSMTSIDISVDGLVYVGDRGGDRVQIFTKEGKFVKEFLVHPKTLGTGTVWATAFSTDPQQKYLYVADGDNGVVRILNRNDGAEVSTIGHKGRFAGEFDSCERLAFDSHGNLYVTEVNHNTRLQKFVLEK